MSPCGPICGPISQASTLPLMTTGALDINTGPVRGRAMARHPWCCSGPYDTLVSGGSSCYSGLYGPGSSTALGHQEGLRWRPRSWASGWPLLAALATESTDSGCSRTTDPNMVLGNSLGPDVIMALVIGLAFYMGSKLRSAHLHDKHIMNWAICPALFAVF